MLTQYIAENNFHMKFYMNIQKPVFKSGWVGARPEHFIS